MKSKKKKPVILPLSHALAWIVASTLLISGSSYAILKRHVKKRAESRSNPQLVLRSIIQTGPQKEALKTQYLAELLGLSADRPCNIKLFNKERAQERLLRSPLISHAEVKVIEPNTLYVDYTIRQPMAWLGDYENVAVDKEGFPIPFSPFFTPKNLPALYFGLAPFGAQPLDPERPTAKWGTPLQGKYVDLAQEILAIIADPKVADLFNVKRIDVSNAYAESYGTREIVMITEDVVVHGKSAQVIQPRILRLSTKNFAQELGNYLKLREQLLEEERRGTTEPASTVRLKEKIIDFRIQKLAFIEERSKV